MANDYSAEIQQLEQLLNSATTGVSADGLSTQFDLDHAKTRLSELRRLSGDTTMVRPRVATINLEGCW